MQKVLLWLLLAVVALPALADSGLNHTDGNFTLGVGGSERMRVTTTGKVGIGNTSPLQALHVGTNTTGLTNAQFGSGTGALTLTSNYASIASNAAFDGSSWKYISNGYAFLLNMDTYMAMQVAPSGTAGNAVTFSPALYIANNGNVGIGTTNPTRKLHIAQASSVEETLEQTDAQPDLRKWNFLVSGGNSTTPANLYIRLLNDAGSAAPVYMYFEGSSGRLGVGTTSPLAKFHVSSATGVNGLESDSYGAATGLVGTSNSTSGHGVIGYNSGANAQGILGSGGGYGVQCLAGNCGGANGWTAYSDSRLKERVVDLSASRGLAAINLLRPVTFHWKDKDRDAKEGERIGFIAQEVEKIYPELVIEDRQTTIKSINYESVVVPLTKAVQELKAENDELRHRVEVLESKRYVPLVH